MSTSRSSDLEQSLSLLRSGPVESDCNDPLHLIRAANYFLSLGKTRTLNVIDEYSRTFGKPTCSQLREFERGFRELDDDTWIFLLLRTIFDVPTPPGFMPELGIGWLIPQPPEDPAIIPRFPIVLIDDIPFSFLWSVVQMGNIKTVAYHLGDFDQATLRTKKLCPPDDPFPSLRKLLQSNAWDAIAGVAATAANEKQYAERLLWQVLALTRTACDFQEAQARNGPCKMADFESYHQRHLRDGARWDPDLQLYVKNDGTRKTLQRMRD